MTPLEEWQVKEIEDTLRLCANYMNASKRDTCLSRMVMVAWNWCHDSLNNIPIEETSNNGIMYRMRAGQIPGDNNKRITSKK